MQPHQTFDDGKSKAGAAVTAVVGTARLKIRLADARQILVADADAIVFDRKADLRRLGASADRDRAAAIAETDRVGYQVEQNLVERTLVGDHFRQIVGPHSLQVHARLARPQLKQVAAGGDDLRRRERLRPDLEIAGLDLRNIEHAVDDREQVMPGPVDEAGIFVAAFGIERQHRLLHQHLGEADDGVERRAQFVAHSGQEPAFGGVGALRLGVRVQKRLLVAFALGDIAQHRNDFATVLPAGIGRRLLERPAAHLDPHEFRRRAAVGIDALPPNPEFD